MVPADEDMDAGMDLGSDPSALLIAVAAVAALASAGAAGGWWLKRKRDPKE
jgi:hypothetical protein